MLENLVTNAFKYTEQGGASLSVSAVPDNSGKCDIIFRIEDTGIGIPDDALSHIYDIFYRVGGKKSHSVEGTGIGLAIVKELIDLMGGTIKAESMVGVGTTFTVRLTLEISDQLIEIEDQASTHYIAPDCRVLAVDDTPENLELLKTLLGRTMMRIDTALSGTEGIRLAVKNEYDIIILDYMMPEMDGIETLSNMKKKGINSVFIALTADAIAGTAAKMSAAGFAEYVTKPVDWQKFEQLLLKYVPKEKLAYESKRQSDLNPEQIQEISSRIENCELDIKYGLRRVDNSLDIYRKILLLFCNHFKQNFDKAEKHMGAMEWEQLCIIVHSLKSQAKGIGSNLLFRMAETMEQKLKQKDYIYAKQAFPLLKLQWERTNSHSSIIAETLPMNDHDTETDIETVHSLTEKAVRALKGNLWLDAREAVESLQKQDKQGNDYEMILQMIEKFDFKNALLKLNSIREDT